MNHNLNSSINNSNDGIIINNKNNNDSNSLEIYCQQEETYLINNKNNNTNDSDLNRTSENNTSVDEKCSNNNKNKDEQNQQQTSKKRKHRRGKKRRNQRFNPYCLSNSEYEKKECEKIQRNREKMVKQGKTLAPFNTTQFIMDEHRNELPVFDSVNSSDMDSDTTVEDIISNEFNEEYENLKLDYYRNLNKDELLSECFQILNELNKLQDTVAKLTNENERLKKQISIENGDEINSFENNYK